jgi:hypothetical protein
MWYFAVGWEVQVWSAAHWIEVAAAVIVFGGLSLLRTIRRRKADNIKLSYGDFLFYGFLGLEFGLLITFGWQAFHRPLVFLVVVVFVGLVVTGAHPLKSQQSSPAPKASLR